MKLHSELSLGWVVLYTSILMSIPGRYIFGDNELQSATMIVQPDSLAGKWKLIEYFQDRGDGTGDWIKAGPTNTDTIIFYKDGIFSASGSSPLTARRFNQYRLTEKNTISFISTGNNYMESYPYVLETAQQLLIYPTCREKCMRRYKLIKQ